MGFNTAQQFDPNTPALAGRGAYGIPPIPGSSNLFGASIPGTTIAGSYMGQPGFELFNNPEFKNMSPEDKKLYMQYYGPSADRDLINKLLDPEAQTKARKQQLEDAAAFYKTQGDQQMKYNLINRGLTALQTGIERGLTKYQDPYSIANMIANGYAEGARSSTGLAQLGAGIPATKYYRV